MVPLGRRLNYHLPLVKMTVTLGYPAKAYHMMGKACFQPTYSVTYTHTSSNRHAHIHLHTPTHMQSSAVSATRCMLSSLCHTRTHTKARISTIKLSAGQEAILNHTLLSLSSPHHRIIIPLNSVGQILQDVTAVKSSVNSLHQCYCFTVLYRSDIRQ